MKNKFVVTIAGGGSTYTPGIVMMLLENMDSILVKCICLWMPIRSKSQVMRKPLKQQV